MAYTALYRKYRPKTFSDVFGQEIIVEILKNSIINNKIGHAYLFAGVRGTGKTSIAKIFAKAVNCINNTTGDACNECETCKNLETSDIDIIEIDAASNNGVDEIREIRNNAKLVPTFSKYKVYIIDEVHMLSSGAFNALLKTLEEPPSHVIFILATTEVNKIPLTILSRCQRFDFKRIPLEILKQRLLYIIEKENKTVDENILKLICELGDGSFRDTINLLDQVIDIKDVDENFLYRLSGSLPINKTITFFEKIVAADVSSVLDEIEIFSLNGISYSLVTEKLLILIRDISINNTISSYFNEEYINVLNKFDFINTDQIKKINSTLLELISDLKKSTNQRITFEIYMINIINIFNEESNVEKIILKKEIKEEIKTEETKTNVLEEKNDLLLELKKIRINNTLATADKSILNSINEKFSIIEDYISNKNYNSIARIILESQIVCAGKNNLILLLKSLSSINILNDSIIKAEELLSKVFENDYKIATVLPEEWSQIKNEFIENLKNGKKYEIIEEKNVIINKERSDIEKEAIEIFGEENITVN